MDDCKERGWRIYRVGNLGLAAPAGADMDSRIGTAMLCSTGTVADGSAYAGLQMTPAGKGVASVAVMAAVETGFPIGLVVSKRDSKFGILGEEEDLG